MRFAFIAATFGGLGVLAQAAWSNNLFLAVCALLWVPLWFLCAAALAQDAVVDE